MVFLSFMSGGRILGWSSGTLLQFKSLSARNIHLDNINVKHITSAVNPVFPQTICPVLTALLSKMFPCSSQFVKCPRQGIKSSTQVDINRWHVHAYLHSKGAHLSRHAYHRDISQFPIVLEVIYSWFLIYNPIMSAGCDIVIYPKVLL